VHPESGKFPPRHRCSSACVIRPSGRSTRCASATARHGVSPIAVSAGLRHRRLHGVATVRAPDHRTSRVRRSQ
jgi:hypothetical protein